MSCDLITPNVVKKDGDLPIVEQILDSILHPNGNTVATRFSPPTKFERIEVSEESFSNNLRTLPLKPKNSLVSYYNGSQKPNQSVYSAVIDLPIGNKDLHQCADAIMRLKARYHWERKEYAKIHFNLTNGDEIAYSDWMQGKRVNIIGNKTQWVIKYPPSNEYKDFWSYLEFIFSYAGTASLEKELLPIPLQEMEIGDVFIKGGFPGHAVLVLDMAVNPMTKEKVFMLGQSYMPAQEFQVLKNNQDQNISPWYALDDLEFIVTPEWTFSNDELKRWKE